MPTRGAETARLADAATEVAERARTIARLELRLALTELREKAAVLGLGAAAGVASAILALYALGFAGATVAAALALAVPTWLALLIVMLGFGVLAGGFGLVALYALRAAAPPVPRQALDEAKLTAEAIRSNGHRAA